MTASSSSTGAPVPLVRPGAADDRVHPLLAGRWSPRAIAERPVPEELLRVVFEGARWAPSSFNEQPWRFLVATVDQPEWMERLRGYLKEGNAWAHRAPVLVASAYRTRFSRNDRPNPVAMRDLGAAEQNLALQALHVGLVIHHMAGFRREELADDLLPDGFEAGAMTVIGYPGDPATLPADKRRDTKERNRRPLEQTVFGPRWGEPASFL